MINLTLVQFIKSELYFVQSYFGPTMLVLCRVVQSILSYKLKANNMLVCSYVIILLNQFILTNLNKPINCK